MSNRAPSLSVQQLMQVFGCSHVTLYNWTRALGFPPVGERTAGAIARWSGKFAKKMLVHPLDVLHGRTKTSGKKLQRMASGRLTSAQPQKRKSFSIVGGAKKIHSPAAEAGGENSPTKAPRRKTSQTKRAGS